ncbi:MAG TPA: peptidase C14 [Candidatus Avipropionibacterium avicola]|uniref:Peptidase C14 n=1 Tax=Candidatus Avipropionibacterium avicola TaxID=2840701 RepID=A0A9D1GYK7_9ACTN|nr:peptidase C14 [Candidatus Avipropionibacterium avicola]
MSEPDPSPHHTGRRALIGAAGVSGLALGAMALAARPAHADESSLTPVHAVSDAARLVASRTDTIADGTLVQLAGHSEPGDGGGRLVRFDATSTADDNGGTVLRPHDRSGRTRPGRWITLHAGTGDFRWFGIRGADHDADDALDALVADPTISRIEAHTDLNFTRRHRFTRSHLVLDFGGHTMTTDRIEAADEDDPFAAVLCFRGEVTDEVHEHELSETMPELRDDYPVGSSDGFRVGQWWALEVNALTGTWERELQRLVRVTQIVDPTHIRVDHKLGWELDAGRTLSWRRIEPVEQVHVRNLRFVGVAGGDQFTGSHPIAYEYAVHCDVENVHGEATFWPLVMRRWGTHFTTRSCSLTNPASVTWGGAGYLTQQIYCNYGHVVDCHTSNARHLNDWTASSYGLVENCHGDGDDQGPFVTHGQYEHDLTYVQNSGLMTFANSGAAWGGAAKRITVIRHVCSWFVARVKVIDLSLQDVQVIAKDGLDGSGMLWINADGAQLRGCRADDTLVISQASESSGRPTVIEDCDFATLAGSSVIQDSVTSPIHLVRTTLTGLDDVAFAGSGPILLDQCRLDGDSGGRLSVAGDLTVRGGSLTGLGLVATAAQDQHVRLSETDVTGQPSGDALLSRADGDGTVTWELRGVHSTATGDIRHATVDTGVNRWTAVGCTFDGGSLELTEDAFPDEGGWVRHSDNVETAVDRISLPGKGKNVLVEHNLTL